MLMVLAQREVRLSEAERAGGEGEREPAELGSSRGACVRAHHRRRDERVLGQAAAAHAKRRRRTHGVARVGEESKGI